MSHEKASPLDILKRVQAAAEEDAAGCDAAAHERLLEEIRLLTLAVETPAERTRRIRFQILQNLCTRMALEYGFLQQIAERDGGVVTAAELASRAGVDETLVARIMRLVTYISYCEETGPNSYASNATTQLVVRPGYTGGEKHFTDLGFRVGARLIDLIRTQGLVQFPAKGQKNPFQHAFDGMGLFEYLQVDAEQKRAFDDYMSVRRESGQPQWFEIFPAAKQLQPSSLKDEPDAALFVDVGGSLGHEAAKFHQRFPDLPGRLIVQDLPETFQRMDVKPKGVEFMEHDFFTEQPVQGAKIYFLRSILHDWPDAQCRTILSQLVKAMDKEYSRVVIDEIVIQDTCAPLRQASLDVLMLLYASGVERTERHWRELLEGVGLEIVRVWKPEVGDESVLEAKRRE